MKLGVYSLQKVLFQGDAKSVNCKTTSGEITILDHHEALISVLQNGRVTIVDNEGKELHVSVDSGFLEVDADSHVKLMVEESE
jgi:F-type H+-transporting ATPase subunit epsilon